MFGIYYTVHSFMTDALGLTGTPLQAFAFIYSFAHDGKERYRASREYMAARIGVSVRTVSRALDCLLIKGLINHREENSVVGHSYGIHADLVDAHLDPHRFGLEYDGQFVAEK